MPAAGSPWATILYVGGKAAALASFGWALLFAVCAASGGSQASARVEHLQLNGWPAADGEPGWVLLLLSLAGAVGLFCTASWLRAQPHALTALAPTDAGPRRSWPALARRSAFGMLASLWLAVLALAVFALRSHLGLQRYFSDAHVFVSCLLALSLGVIAWSTAISLVAVRITAMQTALARDPRTANGQLPAPDCSRLRPGTELAWSLARLFLCLTVLANLAALALQLTGWKPGDLDGTVYLVAGAGCLLLALPVVAWTGFLRCYDHCLHVLAARRGPGPEDEGQAPGGSLGRRTLAASLGTALLFAALLLPLCVALASANGRLRITGWLCEATQGSEEWSAWFDASLAQTLEITRCTDPALLARFCHGRGSPFTDLVQIRAAQRFRELSVGEAVDAMDRTASVQLLNRLLVMTLHGDMRVRAAPRRPVSDYNDEDLEGLIRAFCRIDLCSPEKIPRPGGGSILVQNFNVGLSGELCRHLADVRDAPLLDALSAEFDSDPSRHREAMNLLLLRTWSGELDALCQLVARRAEFPELQLARLLAYTQNPLPLDGLAGRPEQVELLGDALAEETDERVAVGRFLLRNWDSPSLGGPLRRLARRLGFPDRAQELAAELDAERKRKRAQP